MISLIKSYSKWLHLKWPAGTVEKLPEVNEDGSTNINGVYVVGDLTGVPLLKFAGDSGAKAIAKILTLSGFSKNKDPEIYDVIIVGAGVAGISAAIEAKKNNLRFQIFEAAQPFSTIANFPNKKPIFTYPIEMTPQGGLQFHADIKEGLLNEMEEQRKNADITPLFHRVSHLEKKGGIIEVHYGDKQITKAQAVIVAIGRSGNFRKIGCPGEELPKVFNRLHDPKEFSEKEVLVVGGGDSALEVAIALAESKAKVTLSYRKKEFSRPKPGNLEKLKQLPISLQFETTVQKISDKEIQLKNRSNQIETFKNDVVFPMIGREAPLEFFRRSKINIRGEWNVKTWASFIVFFSFCIFVYLWKGGTSLNQTFQNNKWFPFNLPDSSPLWITLREPGFYYSLLYTFCVVFFGFKRIQRRKTPYIKWQTLSLMSFQIIPLFLLPYFVLPYLGKWGFFDSGFLKKVADELFPICNYGHGREYWRAFGFILAWPLFIWNVFTSKPMWGWLTISLFQTFVIVPFIVWRWGKGAYCGWICSCGALAETLGDKQRTKMPHGPIWNRLNFVGQFILSVAFILLFTRVLSWISPNSAWGNSLSQFYSSLLSNWSIFGIPFDYYHIVDIFLAGIVGVGMYFHFSGRVWCRFACPLAALMHIYARFSQFRIFTHKEKCISCNVCTSNCHQGIDIMNFANKGIPMEDPECVRCSACVQSCPTQVLYFGRLDSKGNKIPELLRAN